MVKFIKTQPFLNRKLSAIDAISVKLKTCEVGKVEGCEVCEVEGMQSWPLGSLAKSKGAIWVRFEVEVERQSGFMARSL